MVLYRTYVNVANDKHMDAIGKYVYVSVHIRGTSVNLHNAGGFLLGNYEESSNIHIDENYTFSEDDFPKFRNDYTALRKESIDECIQELNKNIITYQQLHNIITDEDVYLYNENNVNEFYKYNNLIKKADRIIMDEFDNTYCYIIMNYEKVIEELNEINTYCKNNNVVFNWV